MLLQINFLESLRKLSRLCAVSGDATPPRLLRGNDMKLDLHVVGDHGAGE
jgi:hypothetical protein